PQDCDHLSSADIERNIGERWPLARNAVVRNARGIRKRELANADGAANRLERRRIRRIADLRLPIENFEETRGRRRPTLEHGHHLTCLLDRSDYHAEVENKGGERPDRKLLVQHEIAAIADDDERRDARERRHPRTERRVQHHQAIIMLSILARDGAEAIDL